MSPAAPAVPAVPDQVRSLLVVGTGLIGTSLALAAGAAGVDVHLSDHDGEQLGAAVGRGAGRPWVRGTPVDLAMVCVPPRRTAEVLAELAKSGVAGVVSDVASAKAHIQVEAAAAGVAMDRYVGGHPMAGREQSGPWQARVDLFVGRPWVLTPTAATDPRAVTAVRGLVQACGAVPVLRAAAAHDRAVAAVSHLPQLLASALAARLAELSDDDLALAGQGVRDMTRIAGSEPGLWGEIVGANRGAVADALAALLADLARVQAALENDAVAGDADAGGVDAGDADAGGVDPIDAAVAGLVARGNAGRARLPDKHGGRHRDYGVVSVAVPDRPGELARLLTALADAAVNLEDLTVDHVFGQPTGVVDIAVTPEQVGVALATLDAGGWYARVRDPG